MWAQGGCVASRSSSSSSSSLVVVVVRSYRVREVKERSESGGRVVPILGSFLLLFSFLFHSHHLDYLPSASTRRRMRRFPSVRSSVPVRSSVFPLRAPDPKCEEEQEQDVCVQRGKRNEGVSVLPECGDEEKTKTEEERRVLEQRPQRTERRDAYKYASYGPAAPTHKHTTAVDTFSRSPPRSFLVY